MNQKIKDRELNKYYLCVVHGTHDPAPRGSWRAYLFKDEVKKQVYVTRPSPAGGQDGRDPVPDPGGPRTACPWWSAS